MEQGLAATMAYGNGEGQNTQHYYAGAVKKDKKMACKTKGKSKPKIAKGGKK